MTSTKKSFFGRYFRYKLTHRLGLLITSFILNMFCVPFVSLCWIAIGSIMKGGDFNVDAENYFAILTIMAVVTALVCFAVTVFITAAIPCSVFTYHTKRSDADMFLSLPLSANERFWADFSAGAVISILPSVLQMFIGWGLSYPLMSIIDLPNNKGITIPPVFLCAGLIMVVITAFTYALGCFISSACGRSVDTIIYTLVTLALPFIFGVLFGFILMDNSIGLIGGDCLTVVHYMPPFGQIPVLINRFSSTYGQTLLTHNPEEFNKYIMGVFAPKYSAAPIIITIVLVISAWLMSKRRKAEKTGQPFAYNAVYYIISGAALIILAMIFINAANSSGDNVAGTFIVIGLFLTAVMYFLLELLHKRGFKKIWMWAVRYVALIALSFGIWTGLSQIGMAMSYVLPETDDIVKVELEDRVSPGIDYNNIYAIFTDKEEIKLIRNELQPALLADGKKDTYYDYMSLKYTMRDGSTKEFNYPAGPLSDSLDKVRSDVYKTLIKNGSLYATTIEEYLGGTFTEMSVFLADNLSISIVPNVTNQQLLFAAYLKDCESSGLEGELYGNILLSGYGASYNGMIKCSLPVYKDFENTIAFLTSPDAIETLDGNAILYIDNYRVNTYDDSYESYCAEINLSELGDEELKLLTEVLQIKSGPFERNTVNNTNLDEVLLDYGISTSYIQLQLETNSYSYRFNISSLNDSNKENLKMFAELINSYSVNN